MPSDDAEPGLPCSQHLVDAGGAGPGELVDSTVGPTSIDLPAIEEQFA